jgi:hypothetical protein
MGYKDPTYVIFDGDEDSWAYQFMRGWKANERIDFDFRDAHDLDNMTARAQGESYVKRHLKERMSKSSSVLVLVGEKTKHLRKYVPWEIDLAFELGLPIIVVNLNERRSIDDVRCPAPLKNACAIHIPFKMRAIKETLDTFPAAFRGFNAQTKAEGPRHYNDLVYKSWGLD